MWLLLYMTSYERHTVRRQLQMPRQVNWYIKWHILLHHGSTMIAITASTSPDMTLCAESRVVVLGLLVLVDGVDSLVVVAEIVVAVVELVDVLVVVDVVSVVVVVIVVGDVVVVTVVVVVVAELVELVVVAMVVVVVDVVLAGDVEVVVVVDEPLPVVVD